MSDAQSRASATGAAGTGAVPRSEPLAPTPTGWVGWVLFAACMMILLGTFQAITGFVALLNADYYIVGSDQLLVSVSYNGWGWTHLIVGILVLVAGFGVIAGQTWARIAGIALACVSAIVNFGFLAAFPIWSTLLIALDIVVIYALAVHGREAQIFYASGPLS